MARTYSISQINQSGVGVPGEIVLVAGAGDVTRSFAGKFWWNGAFPVVSNTLPGYTPPTPVGYTLIQTTSFDIIENPSYGGRYTVYSPISAPDAIANPSSAFSGGETHILVSELVGAPIPLSGDELNTGSVTNISTYLIAIPNDTVLGDVASVNGVSTLVVPPTIQFASRPLDFVGRHGAPWAESFQQNIVDVTQHFIGPTAPLLPLRGLTWYNTTLNRLEIWNGSAWVVIASTLPGANTTYKHFQAVASTTWVVPHNLNLVYPYIAFVHVFKDTGAADPDKYKQILPLDIEFTSANSLNVEFTAPEAGYVLIRA